MRKYILSLATLWIFLQTGVSGQVAPLIEKQTYTYAVNDGQELKLDRYFRNPSGALQPCVIFMFGGGFATGSRDHRNYIPYFEFLVSEGYTVVSIDYRLGLSNIREKGDLGARGFLDLFINSIDIAVEDLFDATAYVLQNAGGWNIDPAMIIANGSSAGAISVLQGELEICNRSAVAQKLPGNFNYAGVISFAGAVFVKSRKVTYTTAPCPILMFHGTADSNVPYNKIRRLGMGFYGSKYLAGRLDGMNTPYVFYSVGNADHLIAGSPMTDNRQDILSFLDKLVVKGEKLMITSDVEQIGVPKKKKRFGIRDYVRSNFGGSQPQ